MGQRGPKLSRAERAVKRHRIIQLLLRNYSQHEIARREGVSQPYVSYVLKVFNRRLDQDSLAGVGRLRQRQVAKAELREREALEAWERSKGIREISEQERDAGQGDGKGKGKVKLRREHRDGNPAFLREARENSQEVNKLLGLYAADRLEMTGAGGGPIAFEGTIRSGERDIIREGFERLVGDGLSLADARMCLLGTGMDAEDVDAIYQELKLSEPDGKGDTVRES